MFLIMADTTGTQSYIFGSNRLRENIGASYLVEKALTTWALEAIRCVSRSTNVNDDLSLNCDFGIEGSQLDAEVIYTGGGNVLALLREESIAKKFAQIYSRRLLCEAPGLDVAIDWREFDLNGSESLSKAVDALVKNLKIKKKSRAWPAPLLGLSVTRSCESTGLPAVTTLSMGTNKSYAVSADVRCKHDAWKEADARFQKIADPTPYSYPHELDELGRSEGEHSYIAVVHIDSNNMGDRIKRISELDNGEIKPAGVAINDLRNFSQQLNIAAENTLKHLIEQLKGNIESSEIAHGENPDLFVPLAWEDKGDQKELFLPFRPLIVGGDDVTFVCDGRLGLSLAIEFIKEFEKQTAHLPDGKGSASACAGIAIVKSHYPFARAYALAEELCGQAKRFRRNTEINGSCLDWHYATGGLAESITAIRNREYKVGNDTLTLRPLAVKEAEGGLRSWPVVKKSLEVFQRIPSPDEDGWGGKRNKLKALREALREGSTGVRWFLEKYGIRRLPCLPTNAGGSEVTTNGWADHRCAYFDAVEATDWYIPLMTEENTDDPSDQT